MQNPGILFAVPTTGTRPLKLKWATAFKGIVPPINFNMVLGTIEGLPVADARNQFARIAIEKGMKYLFFLGDDVVPPLHCMKQLIMRADNDESVGVVGGVYCSKSTPAAPLVFRENGRGSYWKWKVGEYFPVTGLGMDCTLIRTEVFKGLLGKKNKDKFEWFKTIDTDKHLDGEPYAEAWTEDLYFLNEVIDKTNWKIMCDTSIICEHLDDNGIVYTLPPDSYPMTGHEKALVMDEGKTEKVIDIGCGPKNNWKDFKSHQKVVRVDIREECKPDYCCDVRNLPFDNESFDRIFSSHVLEHFPYGEVDRILSEWLRVLKRQGTLELVLPSLKWAVDNFSNEDPNIQVMVKQVLYGGQSNPKDFHYNGFTPNSITELLETVGMSDIKIEMGTAYNMHITAKK